MKASTDTITNVWDFLADRFNTHKNGNEIHPDAAVNIFIGWPIFLDQMEIQRKYLGTKSLEILDFGCGTGKFLKELSKKGNNVTGMDKSNKMVELSKKNASNGIKLYKEEEFYELVDRGELQNKFDVITSMHVFEWIEDINSTLNQLSSILKKNGIFLFAVFPKKHIIDSLRIQDLFEDFDSAENPTVGFANFDGIKVQTFIRDAEFFDEFFRNSNFDKVLEFYPPYSQYFLKHYKWTGSLYPEMMILAYRKL